jgi:hypothetical protein
VLAFVLFVLFGKGGKESDMAEAGDSIEFRKRKYEGDVEPADDEDRYTPFVSLKQRKDTIRREQELRRKAREEAMARVEEEVYTAGPRAKMTLFDIAAQQTNQQQPKTAEEENEREEIRMLDELQVAPLISNHEMNEGQKYTEPLATRYVRLIAVACC